MCVHVLGETRRPDIATKLAEPPSFSLSHNSGISATTVAPTSAQRTRPPPPPAPPGRDAGPTERTSERAGSEGGRGRRAPSAQGLTALLRPGGVLRGLVALLGRLLVLGRQRGRHQRRLGREQPAGDVDLVVASQHVVAGDDRRRAGRQVLDEAQTNLNEEGYVSQVTAGREMD